MPIYDFVCQNCGPFEQRRSFSEAGDLMMCPSCREEARRVYSVPNTRRMPTALSAAMDRAKKSAYEPEVVQQPAGRRYRPGYGRHCGHNH